MVQVELLIWFWPFYSFSHTTFIRAKTDFSLENRAFTVQILVLGDSFDAWLWVCRHKMEKSPQKHFFLSLFLDLFTTPRNLKVSKMSDVWQTNHKTLEWRVRQLKWAKKLTKGRRLLSLNRWSLGLGPYKKGTFDFSQNLVKTPSGDFKQVSEEF